MDKIYIKNQVSFKTIYYIQFSKSNTGLNTQIIFSSLNVIAIINVIVLCAFLCFRKSNSLPNYVLALLFVIPGLYFIDNLLIVNNVIHLAPYSFFTVQIIANLFPVAVYYYVHLLLTDKKTYHRILLVGSIFLLIYIVGLTIYFGLLNTHEQTNYVSLLSTNNYPLSMTIYNVFFYAWQMVYLLILNMEIKKHQKNAENSLSNLDNIKLVFVKKFMLLLTVLNFGLVVFYIVLPMPTVDYGVLPTMVTVIYLFIIYYSIKNNAIFNEKTYLELITENEPVINTQIKLEIIPEKNLVLSVDQKTQFIISKIETALFVNKLYKNPEFKLSHLADDIKEQSYLTSQILNKHFKKSFFDIVNELRVKDAEIRLKHFDSKKEKIETIAYEVGFNSRASFYRSFKKITGKNPSEFVSLS